MPGEFVTTGAGKARTLHALWDDSGGDGPGEFYVTRFAAEITAEFVSTHGLRRISKDPRKWIEEGLKLAGSEVYSFGPETGSREHPISLPKQYESHTKRVARAQLALAGFRLAYVLNERLK